MKSQNHAPIFEALKKYKQDENFPFHTPGHKQGKGLNNFFRKEFQKDFLSYDLTEVPGLDDLHSPSGVIEEAQALAAKLFRADKSFFLVNGTSSGLQAAIMALFQPGDEILVPRNSHRSIFTGLVYSGAIPRYLYPQYEPSFGITLGITLDQVKDALAEYPQVKGILLIHPNYYGITSEFEEIVKYCKSRQKIVLVDEAHGAHFIFSDHLPISAMEAGADVAVQSTHKTLSSLTQSSLLHVREYSGPFKKIKDALRFVQTSSPSYLLLASLDIMRHQLAKEGKQLVGGALEIAQKIRVDLGALEVALLDEKHIRAKGNFRLDPTKLLINVDNLALDGQAAEEFLRKELKIQVELSDSKNVLALVTIGDDFIMAQRIVAGIEVLMKKYAREVCSDSRAKRKDLFNNNFTSHPKLIQKIAPRAAWFAEKTSVKFGQSKGRILGEEIVPFPPGVPLAIPGEEITDELLVLLEALKESNTKLQGLEDESLEYIRVLQE